MYMHCQDFILLPFAIIWILITLNLLHMFLKCYIAVNHVLTTVYVFHVANVSGFL